jgi:Mg2+/Co2+ transporter CorC
VEIGNYKMRVTQAQQRKVGQVLVSPKDQETMRADGPGEP